MNYLIRQLIAGQILLTTQFQNLFIYTTEAVDEDTQFWLEEVTAFGSLKAMCTKIELEQINYKRLANDLEQIPYEDCKVIAETYLGSFFVDQVEKLEPDMRLAVMRCAAVNAITFQIKPMFKAEKYAQIDLEKEFVIKRHDGTEELMYFREFVQTYGALEAVTQIGQRMTVAEAAEANNKPGYSFIVLDNKKQPLFGVVVG